MIQANTGANASISQRTSSGDRTTEVPESPGHRSKGFKKLTLHAQKVEGDRIAHQCSWSYCFVGMELQQDALPRATSFSKAAEK
jgi:hypothetical protein